MSRSVVWREALRRFHVEAVKTAEGLVACRAEAEHIARQRGARVFDAGSGEKEHLRACSDVGHGQLVTEAQEQAAGLRQCFGDEHPWHDGPAGEMPGELWFLGAQDPFGEDGLVRFQFQDMVHEEKGRAMGQDR